MLAKTGKKVFDKPKELDGRQIHFILWHWNDKKLVHRACTPNRAYGSFVECGPAGRNHTGSSTYPMDVREIRSAFVESLAVSERLQAFKAERLVKIDGGETPLPSVVSPKIVLHLIPLSSLDSFNSRDVTREAARLSSLLEPMKGTGSGGRYNFDGFLVASSQRESYVQVFRSGTIEGAALPFLAIPDQYKNLIPSIDFERVIIEATRRYGGVQARLLIPLPIFVAITLLDVKSYSMSSYNFVSRGQPIDRDNLLLPEVLIEDYGTDIARLLQPAFDSLWQACGQEKSLNYDEQGNWRPHHS